MSTVVGSVSVKVWPDTRNFRKKLQAELAKAERGLDVEIEVKLKDTGLQAEARRVQEKVEREIKNVKIGVDLDDRTSIERAIAQVDRELSKLKSIEIPVDLNERDLRAARELLQDSLGDSEGHRIASKMQKAIQSELNKIQIKNIDLDDRALSDIEDILSKIEETKLKLKPELDAHERRQVERQLERLEDDLKAKVKPEVETVSRRHAQLQLLALARDRVVQLIPVVSKTAVARVGATLAALSGVRVVDKYLTSIKDTLSNLDKSAPKLAVVKLALSTIASYSLTAASNVFALGRSFAQMFPAALALPGILGGITFGIGATIAVLKDFNTVLPEVGKKFHELQDSMSERFWAKAKKPINDMIQKLFPQFQKGLESTSTQLGQFFATTAKGFGTAFDGAIVPMFNNLNKSIAIMETHMGAVASIIQILGTTGSEYLPRLSTYFGNLIDRFQVFLADSRDDGRLTGWIETGIFQMREFGRAIGATGSIFASLARAAERAGGSTLTMFADTLEGVALTVRNTHFQDALVGALEGAHEAMHNIASTSGPAFRSLILHIAQAMRVALPVAGNATGNALRAVFQALDQPEVSRGAIKFLAGIQIGFARITPGLSAVGRALGGVLDLLGTVTANLGDVLTAVLVPLGDAIAKVAPSLSPLVVLLGTTLTSALNNLAPVVHAVADAIIRIAKSNAGPMQRLAKAFVDLSKAVGSRLATTMQKLGQIIAKVQGPIIDLAASALPAVTTALKLFLSIVNGVLHVVAAIPTGLIKAAVQFAAVALAIRGATAAMAAAKIVAFNLQVAWALLGVGATGLATKAVAAKIGIGALGVGLTALSGKAYESSTALGAFSQVAGSAAIGFAVGGPWGAAIGAGVGALQALTRETGKTKEAQNQLKAVAQQVADSLNQETGAITRATREIAAKALADSGAADVASRIGVALGTVTRAATGNKDAIATVQGQIDAYLKKVAESGGNVEAAWKSLSPLTDNVNFFSDSIVNAQNKIAETNAFLHGADFATPFVSAQAAAESLAQGMTPVNELMTAFIQQANTPVAPQLDMSSAATAAATVQGLGFDLDLLGQKNITPQAVLNDQVSFKLNEITGQGAILSSLAFVPKANLDPRPAMGGITRVTTSGNALTKKTFSPKVVINPSQLNAGVSAFQTVLPNAMGQGATAVGTQAKKLSSNAESGVRPLPGKFKTIGSQAGEGLARGIESASGRVSRAADRIVADANRAAAAAAKVKSPSRVWMAFGSFMGQGMAIGMASETARATASAISLVQGTIDAVESNDLTGVGKSIIASFVDGMESKYSTVTKSLEDLSSDMAAVDFNMSLNGQRTAALASAELAPTGTDGAAPTNQLNYYAAETAEVISSEEALFEAAQRARMVFG
jgi:hypothetical protein